MLLLEPPSFIVRWQSGRLCGSRGIRGVDTISWISREADPLLPSALCASGAPELFLVQHKQ